MWWEKVLLVTGIFTTIGSVVLGFRLNLSTLPLRLRSIWYALQGLTLLFLVAYIGVGYLVANDLRAIFANVVVSMFFFGSLYILGTMILTKYFYSVNQDLDKKVELKTAELSGALADAKESHAHLVKSQSLLIDTCNFKVARDLAAGAAHEITGPLSNVIMGAEKISVLAEKQASYEKIKVSATQVMVEGKKIDKIIQSLLFFLQNDPIDKMETFTIRELWESVLFIHRERAQIAKVKIDFTVLDSPDLEIYGTRKKILEALSHLVENAIEWASTKSAKWIRVEAQRDGTSVSIRVSDSGSGIPKELRKTIFQPFFSQQPNQAKTGLGLSVAKGVADSHGGTLEVDNKHPHTSFILRVPLSKEN